jgi:transposase-like protein
MATEWTDEERAQAVEMYLDGEPTPETSMDLVKEIAEQLDKSPNGVRMILSKATKEDGESVYIKKSPAKTEKKSNGTARVSKEDSLNALREAIESAGQEVDEDIVKRLTGKAAQYFTKVVTTLNG